MSKRNPTTLGVWGPTGVRVRTSPANWRKPLQWNKQAQASGQRARVFCASMADVFEDRPELEAWRADLLALIQQTRHLDWLLLTKRTENVNRMIERATGFSDSEKWFYTASNVWLGTSVENQEAADKRIPELLKVPAPVRFLSCEPLLSEINLLGIDGAMNGKVWPDTTMGRGGVGGQMITSEPGGIHWVIAGAESGHGARPMSLDWVRGLRDDCLVAGVPFFFKQKLVDGHKVGLPELDGKQWAEFPAVTA